MANYQEQDISYWITKPNVINANGKEVFEMQKEWYKSKGIWGGLMVFLGGVTLLIGKLLQGELDFNGFLTEVTPLLGTGLGIIGIRVANK